MDTEKSLKNPAPARRSLVGLGGVLLQRIDGQERVVAFISKTLTRAERNYTTTERELLAVIHCVENFRCYFEGLMN